MQKIDHKLKKFFLPIIMLLFILLILHGNYLSTSQSPDNVIYPILHVWHVFSYNRYWMDIRISLTLSSRRVLKWANFGNILLNKQAQDLSICSMFTGNKDMLKNLLMLIEVILAIPENQVRLEVQTH